MVRGRPRHGTAVFGRSGPRGGVRPPAGAALAQSAAYDHTRRTAPLPRPHPGLPRRGGGHVLVVGRCVLLGSRPALPASLRLRGGQCGPPRPGCRSGAGCLSTAHPRGRLLPGPAEPGDPGDVAGPAGGARMERPGQPEVAALPGADDGAGRTGVLQPGDPAVLPVAAAGRGVPPALVRGHLPGAGALPVLRRPDGPGRSGAQCARHHVVDADVPVAAVDGPGSGTRRADLPLPGPEARLVRRGARAHPCLHRRPAPGVRARAGAVERAERDQLDVLPQAQPPA